MECVLGAVMAVLEHGSGRRPPPRAMPEELWSGYTMEGRVPLHYNDSFRWEQLGASGRSARCFLNHFAPSVRVQDPGVGAAAAAAEGREGIEGGLDCRPERYATNELVELVKRASAREKRYYDDTDAYVYAALEAMGGRDALQGMRVAVIGSVEPWYEAICLAFAASECVSVDYNPVAYHHPRLSSMSVHDLKQRVRAAEERARDKQARDKADAARSGGEEGDVLLDDKFDAALCISTLEHDGLGRYGDALDPDADIASIDLLSKVRGSHRLCMRTSEAYCTVCIHLCPSPAL